MKNYVFNLWLLICIVQVNMAVREIKRVRHRKKEIKYHEKLCIQFMASYMYCLGKYGSQRTKESDTQKKRDKMS